MARQNINLGTDPNDGEGDNLRTAFDKVNDNFIEVYTAGPVGSNIVISGNVISSNVTNANIELSPNGIGKVVVKNDLRPDTTNLRYLGDANLRFRGAYVGTAGINSTGDIVTTGNISANNIQYTGEVFVGDLKGSVFADDSTVIVDAIDNAIFADTGVFGTSVQATALNGNSLSLNASGNAWSISTDTLNFPSGASWRSESETADEYISSGPNGYINITTSDNTTNRSQIQIEHGIVQINFFNGSNVSFDFDQDGNLSHPKDFLPQANNTSRNLGSSSEEWYNVYASNVIVSTGLTGVDSSPYPTINNFESASFFGNVTGGNLITAGNIEGTVNGFDIGYLEIPQVSLSANTIAALSDSGKHYYSTTAGDLTLTIPSNANVAFPTGTAFTIVVQAAGNVVVAEQNGDVDLYLAGNATSGNRTVGTYGMATVVKVATNTWFINGTGVS